MATQMTAGDGSTERNTSTAAVQWSELPYDVLGMIRSRVASPRGRVRFTAVCRPWRAAASRHPSPPALPLLLLSSRYGNPMMKPLYCLEDGGVMRVRPPRDVWGKWLVGSHDGGWIAWWQNDKIEPPIVIVNLFSGAEVALSEKQRSFAFNVCTQRLSFIRKITFSEAPTSNSCILAAITDTCRVALCKVGCPNNGWATEGCGEKKLEDIAFCHGELYGITRYGEKLFKFDVGVDKDDAPVVIAAHLLVTQRYDSPSRWSVHNESVVYLIELRRKLIMAQLLPPERETSFKLFELVDDAYDHRWVDMRSLDDHALFLGPNCSTAVHVPVGVRHGVERNTIYYSNHGITLTYLTRTDINDPMYSRKDKSVDNDMKRIKSIGYYVRDGPYTPTWLLPPII